MCTKWVRSVTVVVAKYHRTLLCFRYQLFLQIKDDILAGRLECPFDYAVELGALALQCKSYHALTAVLFGIKVQRDDSFMQMAN